MELGKGVIWRFRFENSRHADISLMITLAESIGQREQVVQDRILMQSNIFMFVTGGITSKED